MTPSLQSTWKEIFEWAERNSVLNSLIHIANTTQILQHPDFIIVIFNFITEKTNYRFICEWADTDEVFLLPEPASPAQHLYRLANAAIVDGSLLHHYKIQTEMSAARFLQGELAGNYLFAMLYQKVNDMGFDDLGWINKLKLWLLVQAMDRELSGNVQDNYLKVVSEFLRSACHQSREKRKAFLGIQRSVSGFSELNRHLVYSAKLFLKKNPSPAIARVLNNIIQVARFQHSKIKNPGDLTLIMLPGQTSVPSNNLSRQPREPASDVLMEDDDLGAPRLFASKPGAGRVAEVESEERASHFHQELRASGIILYGLEDSNFLPWAWNKPNSHELSKLVQWCEENILSPNSCDRILAALVWISTRIGRSFRRALDIKVTDQPAVEWVINESFTTLSRTPPQRKGSWQPDVPDKKQHQKDWVIPAATCISISLPDNISKIFLKEAKITADLKRLGDIWNGSWGKNQESVLLEKFSRDVPRVLPGMLGNVMPQICFDASHDQVFARLAGSHPNSSLPSSCAYASWNCTQANIILDHDLISLPLEVSGEEDSIALGSRLAAIESLLVESIRRATVKLESLRQGQNIVAFHNAYECYMVVGLFAATGSRPVTDAFESVRHFDFQEWFVYLNDKSSGVARDGRLVPLPEKICKLVGSLYLAHLGTLAKLLKVANPELSHELELMAKGFPSGNMPFFFLLDSDYRWKNVSQEMIASQNLFDWPLPMNIFRHRLSTWLRHHWVDPEIIDSILGHAEKGHATHWDYSLRVWNKDMDVLRPLLAQAYCALGFETPAGLQDNLLALPAAPASHKSGIAAPALFGIYARKKARRKKLLESIRDAKLLVREFLEVKKKKLTEFSSDEIYDLSKKLLFNDSGMPHSAGQIKYKFLLRLVELSWRKEGKRVPTSRRFVFLGDESSLFTDKAPNALRIFNEIRAAWEDVLKQADNHNISLLPASIVAVVALCIENRISFHAMHKDIRAGKNFRLVALKGNVYIEYANGLDVKNPDSATRRFRISTGAAIYLCKVLAANAIELANHPVPDELLPIADILENHRFIKNRARCNEFIAALCGIIDQINAITLPGVLAAYLAGRVETYSLSWRDWVRLELGHAPDIPAYKPGRKDEGGDDPEIGSIPAVGQVNMQHLTDLDIEISQQAGRELLKKIDKLLGAFQKDSQAYFETAAEMLGEPVPQATAFRGAQRKDLARTINSMVASYGDKTSSAIQVLGKWVTALLFRKARGRGKLVAISTVVRYLDALAKPFVKTGYSIDLLVADDDVVTEFYSEVIESLEVQDTRYVADCLVQFHKWAKNNFGIEDPDWVELPETFSSMRVSPGVITENEYQRALSTLLTQGKPDSRENLAPAFLLICCFRFSMRSGEVFGMLREDWVAYPYTVVIMVKNNRFRKLKTPTSRRQVPLVFDLSELEGKIIERWLAHAESVHGSDMGAPLFFDEDKNRKLMSATIKRTAIDALKTETGNPMITLHHARHAAANRVALALCGVSPGLWQNLSGEDSPDGEKIPALLLGDNRPSRRKSWAIARYLGHVRLLTTLRNYIHFLGEWAETYSDCGERGHAPNLRYITVLDKFPPVAVKKEGLLGGLTHEVTPPTPYAILKLTRLAARGRPCKEAGIHLGFDEVLVDKLDEMLRIIGRKASVRKMAGRLNEATDSAPFPFLYRIKESAWKRLIALTAALRGQPKQVEVPSLMHVACMIGTRRQIIMWEEWQFALMQAMLDHFDIKASHYQVVHTDNADQELIDCAKNFGFSPMARNEWKPTVNKNAKKNKDTLLQIDGVSWAEGGRERIRVDMRCALIWSQSDDGAIRCSFELMAVFCAFAFSAWASGNIPRAA